MNPLVSVIIPAYNVEKYIGESIASVLGQTFTNWELIIINDGSTDKTQEVVEQFLTDKRIVLVNQQNKGVSAARNKGLSLSHGDYISFLDGDDLWNPEFLREMVNAKAQFAYCGYTWRLKDGRCIPYGFNYLEGNILLTYCRKKHAIPVGTFLIRRSILTQYHLNFTNGATFAEDAELIMKVLTFVKADPVPKDLVTIRQREGSTNTSSWDYSYNVSYLSVYERLLEFIATNYDGTDKEIILEVLQKNIGHDRYRLLWKMIIHKKVNETLKLLNDSMWIENLDLIYKNTSMHHKLRIKIILSKNIFLWNLVGRLHPSR